MAALAKMPSKNPRTLGEIIDDLGEARRLKSLWQPQVNPHAQKVSDLENELTITLGREHPKLAPEEQLLIQGNLYQLEVTPCENRQELTEAHQQMVMLALKKAKIPALEVFSTTLTAIRKCKALGQAWLDANVPKKRTGPRDFRLTPLSSPSQEAKAA